MRRLISIGFMHVLLGATLFWGCGRDSGPDLSGEWEWIRSTGGFGGWTLTPDSVGYTQTLVFGSRNKVSVLRNGSLHSQGTYRVSRDTDDAEAVLRVEGDGLPLFMEMLIVRINTTLELMDECADCYIHIYRRLK